MSRYKKIDTRIWGDDKFRRLSAPNPSAQFLWFRLIVPRESTNLPGLICAGELQLSDEIGWRLKKFRQVFEEIASQRMAEADWKSRLIFVPQAIKYHQPESPNVIKSWAAPWDEVPECDLKDKAYWTLRQFISEHMSPPFLHTFDQSIPRGFTKGLPKGFQEGFAKGYGESGAGAVTGAVTGAGTGTGTGANSSLKTFPKVEINTVRIQGSALEKKPNGLEKTSEKFQKLWAPNEGFLRMQTTTENFAKFFADIQVIDVNHTAIVLAVHQALIDRDGGERQAAELMTGRIREANTGLLRGRILKLVSIEQLFREE